MEAMLRADKMGCQNLCVRGKQRDASETVPNGWDGVTGVAHWQWEPVRVLYHGGREGGGRLQGSQAGGRIKRGGYTEASCQAGGVVWCGVEPTRCCPRVRERVAVHLARRSRACVGQQGSRATEDAGGAVCRSRGQQETKSHVADELGLALGCASIGDRYRYAVAVRSVCAVRVLERGARGHGAAA